VNYRHIFHAGNFADVFKHGILTRLLEKMTAKEKGFCYIDTHAGIGMYDLTSPQSLQSPEYLHGIARLLSRKDVMPTLKNYVQIIQSLQTDEALKYYPGSPWIAKNYLRPQDQLILNELHVEDFQSLKKNIKLHGQIHIHCRDAYEFLPAVLPQRNVKRALILIDPPYEKANEFEIIFSTIKKCLQKFPQGVYAIWYPIIGQRKNIFLKQVHFLDEIKNLHLCPVLFSELVLADSKFGKEGLIGCGMIVLNPPWKIEDDIANIAEYLLKIFREDEQGFQLTALC
jgi:23S rRNA (adenine2030-N6)-methyltransferase